jgi:hypothetical protein
MVKFLGIFIIIVFGLSACQKEISGELSTPQTPTSTTNDSVYLSKVVVYDYDTDNTYSSVVDSTVWLYTYDNLKRVKKISVIQNSDTESVSFYYNGNDVKLQKSIDTFTSMGTIQSAPKYFFYNANGSLAADSSLYNGDTTVTSYQYLGNFIHAKSITKHIGSTEIQLDTAVLSNGNLISDIRWSINGGVKWKSRVSTMTYDLGIDPSSTMSCKDYFGIIPALGAGGALHINNLIKETYNDFDIFGNTLSGGVINQTNTYNTNNQLKLVKSKGIYPNSSFPDNYAISKFYYTAL